MKCLTAMMLVAVSLIMPGCGGGSGGGQVQNATPTPSNNAITDISVSAATGPGEPYGTIAQGQTLQLSGNANCGTGTCDHSIKWSVPAAGASTTLTQTGATTATVTFASGTTGFIGFVATSVQDPTRSASLNVSVIAAIAVTTTCVAANVAVSGTVQCSAQVSGTPNQNVAWKASAGTISSGGLFTAPGTNGPVTITATSAQDTARSGTATISVVGDGGTFIISPSNALISPGGSQKFTTIGASGAVIWSVSDTTMGSIDATGLYTAGSNSGAVTVVATLASDATKTASANLTQIFVDSQNTLAVTATEMYLLDPSNCTVYRFKPTAVSSTDSHAVADGKFVVQPPCHGISADLKTGYLVVDGAIYDPAVIDPTLPNKVSPRWSLTSGIASAASGGNACAVQLSANTITCAPLAQTGGTGFTGSTGPEPAAIAINANGLGIVLNRNVGSASSVPSFWTYSTPSAVVDQRFPSTFTPSSQLPTGQGGWWAASMSTGKNANVQGVLSYVDRSWVEIHPGVPNTIFKQSLAGIPGNPMRVVADETRSKFWFAFVDGAAGVSRFARFDSLATTGGLVLFGSLASSQAPVGFGVTADGKYLVVCGASNCQLLTVPVGAGTQLPNANR